MTIRKAEEKPTFRQVARRRFTWAFAATLLPQGIFCLAEDGVRELRSPAEMEKVAPVRAVGIRLMPAVPFDPVVATPHAIDPTPSSPTSPLPIPEPKLPERIVPKPKVALTTTDKQLIQSFQVVPQAPIRLSFTNNSATLASASTAVAETPATPEPRDDSIQVAETTQGTETSKGTRWHASLPTGTAVELATPVEFASPIALPSPKDLVANQPSAGYPTGDVNVESHDVAGAPASKLETHHEALQRNAMEPEADRGGQAPVRIAISIPQRVTSYPTALPEALPVLVAPPPPAFTDGASRPLDVHDPEPVEPVVSTPAIAPGVIAVEAPLPYETKPVEAIPLRLENPRVENPREVKKPSYTAKQLEQAIAVELESQSAREILVDVPFDGILVSDEKVCRAMASDGRVYLVGLELGEAMVEVQPTDGMPSRLLSVKVVAPWQRSNGALELKQLEYAIRPLSPDGNLSIQPKEDGSLIVRGTVDSKETAKRIMELIRKMILVPVVDKLEIR